MNTCLLVISITIYIPSMDKNLIPSFLMREAGLLVHFVESIHCGEEVFHESHSLIIQEDYIEIRISLRLYFIFHIYPLKILHLKILKTLIILKQYSSSQTQRFGIHTEIHMKRKRTTLSITKEI